MYNKKIKILKILLVLIIFSMIMGGIFNLDVVKAENRIAIVFATGGLGDKSFNDSAYRGIQEAEEKLDITYDYAEPGSVAEYETLLTQFAQKDQYDMIISIGFDQADPLENVAASFPDQKFALIDAVVDKSNVASYVYNEEERGFLMGVASAMMTTKTEDPYINEEKVIGVIGGMKIPLIDANIAGFIEGAEYIDSDVEVKYSYVGSWEDPSKAKELALSLIEEDADIIWQAAGRSGLGVIKAAKEEDCYAIGADSDQAHEAPENVLTNGMKFVDNTVFIAVEQVINNEFEAGIHNLGIAEEGLGYTESLLTEDIVEELETVKEKIINGEITISKEIEEVQ
ncbi:MAG: BMP family lipoprotein [Bacillota bacterium]